MATWMLFTKRDFETIFGRVLERAGESDGPDRRADKGRRFEPHRDRSPKHRRPSLPGETSERGQSEEEQPERGQSPEQREER